MYNSKQYVLNGPQLWQDVSNESVGVQIHRKLAANIHLQKPLIRDETNSISMTCKEVLERSVGIALWLKENGFKRNDMICICSENSINFFMPVLAAFYSGIIVSSINHTYSEGELIHALNLTKPKVAFCSKSTYPKFLQLFRQKKILYLQNIIILETLHETLRYDKVVIDNFKPLRLDPSEQVAVILYSSGTTGLPKGVMITHANMNLRYNHSIDSRLRLTKNDTSFVIVPFFHAYGFMVALGSIQSLHELVFLQKFDEKMYLNCIQKYKIEEIMAVPPLMIFLAKHPMVAKYDLSSVKTIGCGAACLSKDIEDAVKRRLNVDTVRQAYGLTEVTLGVSISPLDCPHKPGSSGKVVPGMSMIIRDPDTGENLPANKLGEICVKGGLVMKGYYDNPAATRATFTQDGWLLTGDLGYYDDDGFIYIIDRLKELIKYKGYQVPPAELEALLLSNRKIKDAAVIGLPDEQAGELPVAFVVKQPEVLLTEREVIDFVAKQVSPPKRLRGGVVFLTEIPKNASGKILRRELKKLIPGIQKVRSKL